MSPVNDKQIPVVKVFLTGQDKNAKGLLPTILTWDKRESATKISKLALLKEQIENFDGITLKLHWVDGWEAQGHVLCDKKGTSP